MGVCLVVCALAATQSDEFVFAHIEGCCFLALGRSLGVLTKQLKLADDSASSNGGLCCFLKITSHVKTGYSEQIDLGGRYHISHRLEAGRLKPFYDKAQATTFLNSPCGLHTARLSGARLGHECPTLLGVEWQTVIVAKASILGFASRSPHKSQFITHKRVVFSSHNYVTTGSV